MITCERDKRTIEKPTTQGRGHFRQNPGQAPTTGGCHDDTPCCSFAARGSCVPARKQPLPRPRTRGERTVSDLPPWADLRGLSVARRDRGTHRELARELPEPRSVRACARGGRGLCPNTGARRSLTRRG